MDHFKLIAMGMSVSLLSGCVTMGGAEKSAEGGNLVADAEPVAKICNPISPPPAKPDKVADFAVSTAENVGRNVVRNTLFGQIPGGNLVSTKVIRTTEDLNGVWKATDGSTKCGCTVDLRDRGLFGGKYPKMIPKGCTSQLRLAASYSLGHSFTGYDAPLTLYASDGKSVVAKLNRDGVHYFSGKLSDGTPVTIWRRGE